MTKRSGRGNPCRRSHSRKVALRTPVRALSSPIVNILCKFGTKMFDTVSKLSGTQCINISRSCCSTPWTPGAADRPSTITVRPCTWPSPATSCAATRCCHRRPAHKRTWPGVWSNACCGHPRPGETLRQAVTRHLGDELGVTANELASAFGDFAYRAEMDDGTVERDGAPS